MLLQAEHPSLEEALADGTVIFCNFAGIDPYLQPSVSYWLIKHNPPKKTGSGHWPDPGIYLSCSLLRSQTASPFEYSAAS